MELMKTEGGKDMELRESSQDHGTDEKSEGHGTDGNRGVRIMELMERGVRIMELREKSGVSIMEPRGKKQCQDHRTVGTRGVKIM